MVSETQWYVYMIRTQDAQLYTGITTDIQRRWREHCSGKAGARYFRAHKPQAVVYLEIHPDRSTASKREAAIKDFKKIDKENLMTDFSTEDFMALAVDPSTLTTTLTPTPL